MTSSDKFDDLLDPMENEVNACLADTRRLPPKFRDLVSHLQKKAHAVAKDIRVSLPSLVKTDQSNKFRDLLTIATKKLRQLARIHRRCLDDSTLERLQTSLDDLDILQFRVRNQHGSSWTVAGMFTDAKAKEFWCDSFGSKV